MARRPDHDLSPDLLFSFPASADDFSVALGVLGLLCEAQVNLHVMVNGDVSRFCLSVPGLGIELDYEESGADDVMQLVGLGAAIAAGLQPESARRYALLSLVRLTGAEDLAARLYPSGSDKQ